MDHSTIEQEVDDTDYYDLCKHLILAAKRPLSLPEFYFAMISSLSEYDSLFWNGSQIPLVDMEEDLIKCSEEELEVSGGIRLIVQFKCMTPIGGNAEDHKAMALCYLRTLKYASRHWRHSKDQNEPSDGRQ